MPILIAFDGSPHGEASLLLGAKIAQQGSEPLTILTVNRTQGSPQSSNLQRGQWPSLHTCIPLLNLTGSYWGVVPH